MKFTLKSLAVIALSILLFLPSCKKDDQPEKSILTVRLDGKNFQSADVDATEDQYGILTIEMSNATGQVMIMVVDMYAGKGSYDLSATTIPKMQYVDNAIYDSESGTLKIEENNEKDEYIRGTFSGTLSNSDESEDKLSMTEGEFFIWY
jgi:hypothetical protein